MFVQSLGPFEGEKIYSYPSQNLCPSNELKNYSETIEIGIDSKYHQNMVVGYKGSLIFNAEFNSNYSNIFDPETIEQETIFTTIIYNNKHSLNTTCRLWKPTDEIKIVCDNVFFELGYHSVRIGNKSFEYRNKYLINVNFFGEKDFTFKQIDTDLPFWKEVGYSNIYHKNHADDLNIHYDEPLITTTFEEEENITELYIKYEDNQRPKYIGYYGFLNFVVDFNDSETNIFNSSDIEEKTNFNTTITDDNSNLVRALCKLWKPTNEKLNLFCQLINNYYTFDYYKYHSFDLKSSSFYYNDQKFVIIQNNSLSFYPVRSDIPFLYSSKQVLNIDENIQTYYLTFKIGDYHNELLFMKDAEGIGEIIVLDECSVEGKELKCKLEKDTIEEYTLHDGQKFLIFNSYPYNENDIIDNRNYIPSIYDIYINYPFSKKNISVEIVKLLEDNIDRNNYIAYETNVTDIANIYSSNFTLALSNRNDLKCSMRKSIGISLTMICIMDKEGEFSLGQIQDQTILNNINIKYNFVIQPINNNEKCKISGEGGSMIFALPKVLDFTSKDKIYTIFAMKSSRKLSNIRLNPDEDEIECRNYNATHKGCEVRKTHFKNLDTLYYYTYHSNHNDKSIIFYESSPLKVILPKNEIYIWIKKENNKDKIKLKEKDPVIVLVTDFNNKKLKKFNNNDNITFTGTFLCEREEKYYDAICSFITINDDNLRIICKFKTTFYRSDIYLLYTTLNHNNYKIFIEQKKGIEFELCNDSYIPLLYSDRQEINIKDNESLYELKFDIVEYNNEPLFIYGSNNNYANFDSCDNNTNEITCQISKEILEEILVKNNEQFKVGAMSDIKGILSFEHISNITIKYENVQKQDIYLEINEIIGGSTKKGVPVGLVTNVTEIPNFISAKFDDMKYFKKVTGRPLILFYNYSFDIDYKMKSNYTEEVIINDIHYKYNFRIQPSKFEGNISVKEEGANILLSYPQELIYTLEDREFNIMFIMDDPTLEENIKIDYYAENKLHCSNLNRMKLCTVSKFDFKRKLNRIYYMSFYYKSQNRMYYDLSPINVTKPFELYIHTDSESLLIGDKGILHFQTDLDDSIENVFNDSNIEEDTHFSTTINCFFMQYRYLSCHLWKNTNNIVFIFCEFYQKISCEYFGINGANFIYNKLDVNIKRRDYMYFVQLEKPIPLLYSKSQTINIEEGKNTYYLKFKAENYQNEKVIIQIGNINKIILDKWTRGNNELIFPINKSEIEEYYISDYLDFNIYYPYSRGPLIRMPLIDKVFVNYNISKIDLNITIDKLLEYQIDKNNIVAYEVKTNVTNLSNFVTKWFQLDFFILFFSKKFNCKFKKAYENPLYLLCEIIFDYGYFNLDEIKKEIILN